MAVMLSTDVEKAVNEAMDMAKKKRHEFASVEHLCLVLFDNNKIASLLEIVGIKKDDIKERFLEYIDNYFEVMPEATLLKTVPSLGFQRVLERAAVHVISAGKNHVDVEHVLVAAFDEDESHAVYLMKQAGINRLDLVSVISHSSPMEEGDPGDYAEPDGEAKKLNTLSRYTLCLTEAAKRGQIEQVIGREKEIDRALWVLSRKKKNHPLFVGEPGVGKTALAEGLALKIVNGEVPDHLKDAQVYLLDMGLLLAGARYRGDFESRIKSVIKQLEQKKCPILVIDEIHTVIGAGSTSGSSMDASNLLKPILSKGKIRFIGSTTYKEYRAHLERDRALARRFQKIDIKEPSPEECLIILSGLSSKLSDFHQVKIDAEVLPLVIELSQRYIQDRFLPDKAIDLLDETCAKIRCSSLVKNKIVNKNVLLDVISSIANIPSEILNKNDENSLKDLQETLQKNVYGQEEATKKIVDTILMSKAGLGNQEKPIASFLFSGPSGVGKTEIAKVLAKALGISLIRFDMSEYMERHAVSRLVGAPPGYVGYDEGGLLTEGVNKNPHAVLLLDEIEKAHPDAFNMFLQIMDYGKLTDTQGKATDFRHVILIMTSNVGAKELDQRAIGFTDNLHDKQDNMAAIKRLFSPEFRNRLDAIVTFNKLPINIMEKVIDKFINELQEKLSQKNIEISLSNEVVKYLIEKGSEQNLGARPLARLIEQKITMPIAHQILFGPLKSGGKVVVNLEDGEIILQNI